MANLVYRVNWKKELGILMIYIRNPHSRTVDLGTQPLRWLNAYFPTIMTELARSWSPKDWYFRYYDHCTFPTLKSINFGMLPYQPPVSTQESRNREPITFWYAQHRLKSYQASFLFTAKRFSDENDAHDEDIGGEL